MALWNNGWNMKDNSPLGISALLNDLLLRKVEANNIEFQAGMIEPVWVRKCPQCGAELSKLTGERWYCMVCKWEEKYVAR